MIVEKTYSKPKALDEAILEASKHRENCKFIAGGTDVMVNKYQGNDSSLHLIDITGLEELKGIWNDDEFVYIGALTKLDDLKKSTILSTDFPVLMEAAKAVGSPLIRKTATIGGNILCENRCIYYNQSEWWREAAGFCLKCNGNICIASGGKKACFSEFVSDTAPYLISINAKVKLINPEGASVIALEELYTGDGVNSKIIDNTTILKEIMIPLSQGYRSVFKKLRQRESLEFTSLTTAVSVDHQNVIRIVLAGVDPKPVLVIGSLTDDKEELIKKAIKRGRSVENDMFSRIYRKEMIGVFLRDSFQQLDL